MSITETRGDRFEFWDLNFGFIQKHLICNLAVSGHMTDVS